MLCLAQMAESHDFKTEDLTSLAREKTSAMQANVAHFHDDDLTVLHS